MSGNPDAIAAAARQAAYAEMKRQYDAELVRSQLKALRKAGIEVNSSYWDRHHLAERLEALGVWDHRSWQEENLDQRLERLGVRRG